MKAGLFLHRDRTSKSSGPVTSLDGYAEWEKLYASWCRQVELNPSPPLTISAILGELLEHSKKQFLMRTMISIFFSWCYGENEIIVWQNAWHNYHNGRVLSQLVATVAIVTIFTAQEPESSEITILWLLLPTAGFDVSVFGCRMLAQCVEIV